jgi:hypothetical protein
VRQRTDPKGDQCTGDPLQGVRLGEEGTERHRHAEVDRAEVDRADDRRILGALQRVETAGREAGWQLGGDTVRDLGDVRAGRRQRLTPMAATDWITLAEAAEILAASNVHFTTDTIGGWARSGRLQSIKLGGRRFVRRGEVRALVTAPRRVRAEDLQPGLFQDLDP